MAANNIYPSKTESFIQKARNVHNDFYDYSLVDYKHSHTKITIICTEHGEFEQTPGNHLNGLGCSKCAYERRSENRKSNTESFIEKGKEIHGHDKFDYSLVDYKTNKTKVTIICTEHGNFEQTPHNHLEGKGCPKCYHERRSESKKLNRESFIERAKEVHNDFYDYPLFDYKNALTKVTIVCPEHGNFQQTPNSHLRGQGCPKCTKRGIFNKKFLKYNPERAKENCIFYTIEMFNDEEKFIKCGITQGTIQGRFGGLNEYDYEIVDSFETTLEDAINLEYYFAENFVKYRPKNKFGGYTECFQLEEKENILQQVEY